MEKRTDVPEEKIRVQRAFISTHDKTALLNFASFLAETGIELFATEGTASYLRKSSVPVRSAEELTGFEELLSGKVKSLSARLHAGILFTRSSSEERAQIEEQGIKPIDMVIANFYPFRDVTQTTAVSEAIKMIDIGGPAALRAAAKNCRWVVPVPEPGSYEKVMQEIKKHRAAASEGEGILGLNLSLELATLTFAITSDYDELIKNYFKRRLSAYSETQGAASEPASPFPEKIGLELRKMLELRYGENPHQAAGFYVCSGTGMSESEKDEAGACFAGDMSVIEKDFWGRQLQGKELSFNNLLDLDAAVSACREFERPSCVIVKHRSPCGASTSAELLDAYVMARDCDPLSVFGGVQSTGL